MVLIENDAIEGVTQQFALADQVAIARSILNELEHSAYREGLATLIDEQTFREV